MILYLFEFTIWSERCDESADEANEVTFREMEELPDEDFHPCR